MTRAEKERIRKKRELIVGVVLTAVLLLSTFGYAFMNNKGASTRIINYNGFKFQKQDIFWVLNINNLNFYFKYLPDENIKINITKKISDYYQKPLYIYSEEEGLEKEIYQNLINIAQRIQPACPENESDCNPEYPIKDCTQNFIIIKEGNGSVEEENNCVIIYYQDKEDALKKIDLVLFKILGIE